MSEGWSCWYCYRCQRPVRWFVLSQLRKDCQQCWCWLSTEAIVGSRSQRDYLELYVDYALWYVVRLCWGASEPRTVSTVLDTDQSRQHDRYRRLILPLSRQSRTILPQTTGFEEQANISNPACLTCCGARECSAPTATVDEQREREKIEGKRRISREREKVSFNKQ